MATCGIALVIGWICVSVFGVSISQGLAGKFGDKLLRAADGVVADPARFFHARMMEALWLATLAVVLAIALTWGWRRLGALPRLDRSRGLLMGFALFAAANILLGAGGNTASFWLLLHDLDHVDNLVRYEIKKNLLEGSGDRQRVFLVGNSQANRAIDETVINRTYAETAWVSEMTQPGARGFDLLVLGRDMGARSGDTVIFYLSEISFHGMSSGLVVADFLKLNDLQDMAELGGFRWIDPDAVKSGAFGRMLPTYRMRQPIANRLLTWQSVQAAQKLGVSGPVPSIEDMARKWAPTLKTDDASQFERNSFERLIGELIARECAVILIPGHLHPTLRREMDPRVQESFRGWYQGLQNLYPLHVTYLGPVNFLTPKESDFDDLVHFNHDTQRRFTNELSGLLRGVLGAE